MSFNTKIVFGFFLVNFIIGILASRNIKTIKDYVLANRSYELPILVMTLVATYMGANNIIAMPDEIYKHGAVNVVRDVGRVRSF